MPLAPQRIPALLAVEVQANGKTSFDQRPSGSDLDGHGEPVGGEGRIADELKLKTGLLCCEDVCA
jgi:hypothetical protein